MGEWPSSSPVTEFHGRVLPEPAVPAGYAALIDHYGLRVPLPARLAAVARRPRPISTAAWRLVPPRDRTSDTLRSQLLFALRWEGVDLGVLCALFKEVRASQIEAMVASTTTGVLTRRLWFLYEWLTGTELDIREPEGRLQCVSVLDPADQVALKPGEPSARHRVIDNLPGTRRFCPMIRRTPRVRAYAAKHLDREARTIAAAADVESSASLPAALSFADAQASFALEGERPSALRISRLADVTRNAGLRSLTLVELVRLQRMLAADARLSGAGVRTTTAFVGARHRQTHAPIPDRIGARPDDLTDLLEGLVDFTERSLAGSVDAVYVAAAAAFGFLSMQPFSYGTGHLHRWLVHHVLDAAGWSPGTVLPVSAAIVRAREEYEALVRSQSGAFLPFIEWRGGADGRLEILNATADHYRYFDATRSAEFLSSCVEETVLQDLPRAVRSVSALEPSA